MGFNDEEICNSWHTATFDDESLLARIAADHVEKLAGGRYISRNDAPEKSHQVQPALLEQNEPAAVTADEPSQNDAFIEISADIADIDSQFATRSGSAEDLSQEPYYYRLLEGDQKAWQELISLLPPNTKVIPPGTNVGGPSRILANLKKFFTV